MGTYNHAVYLEKQREYSDHLDTLTARNRLSQFTENEYNGYFLAFRVVTENRSFSAPNAVFLKEKH